MSRFETLPRFDLSLMITLLLSVGVGPATGSESAPGKDERVSRRRAIEETRKEIESRIEMFGGIEAIRSRVEPFRVEVRQVMEEQKDNGVRTFKVGDHDFNKAISTSAIKPTWKAEAEPNLGTFSPLEVILDFDRKLKELGIDLIAIPVPSKIEVYSTEFESEMPEEIPLAVGRLEAMLDLLAADVEVLDVLPTLFAIGADEDGAGVPLYETTGHHISGYGVRACGQQVAERLERYDFKGRDKSRFRDKRRRSGERITPSKHMLAWQVRFDGKAYEHVEDSEVVIIGDSNAFAYGSSSWASHIARATGIPVTDLSTSSGASTAHVRLASLGLEKLKKRRVVIWIITSTHLERFPWKKTDLPKEATITGLLNTGRYADAVARYEQGRARGEDPLLDEDEINSLGYKLLREERDLESALSLFELNVAAFPYSANARDSLGEAYLRAERKEDAKACLEACLALNPSDSLRKTTLERLSELGLEFEVPEIPSIDPSRLKLLTGTYSLTGKNRGIVTLESGDLVFEFVGQQKLPLDPIDESIFTSSAGFTVLFTRSEEGRGIAVRIQGRGMRFEGPSEEIDH